MNSKVRRHIYGTESEWKLIRKRVLERDGYACTRCGSKERLAVHHLDYRNPRSMDSLVTLCDRCHLYVHHSIGAPRLGKPKVWTRLNPAEYRWLQELKGILGVGTDGEVLRWIIQRARCISYLMEVGPECRALPALNR